jgi:crotonobetainyl-CoA:carnitine CoA-transferase CaiB-like acyl-CoA transferase
MGVVKTADGFINIAVGGEGQWRSFCPAIGRDDLTNHPDYATQDMRYRNRPALMAELATVFATKSSQQWLEALEIASVPAGPIYKMDDVFADPQVEHLGIAVPVQHHARGDMRLVGQPVDLSRTPSSIVAALPEPGEHTDDILREIGCPDSEIDALRRERVI